MRPDIEDYLQSIADAFLSGDIRFLLRRFARPMVVYRPGSIALNATGQDLHLALSAMMIGLKDVGAVSARILIHEIIEEPSIGSISCDFDVEYLDAKGNSRQRSRLRYFLEPFASSYRIVMVDYEKAAFDAIFETMQRQH